MQQTVDLGRTTWLGITLQAMGWLGELHGTRLEDWAGGTTRQMLAVAKETLEHDEYRRLLFAAFMARLIEGKMPSGRNGGEDTEEQSSSPIARINVQIEDECVAAVLVAPSEGTRREWKERVLHQLAHDESAEFRAACARELGRRGELTPRIRDAMVAALLNERGPSVRGALAEALGSATGSPSVRETLLLILQSDDDPEVRGSCARSLAQSAESEESMRGVLASILGSADPPSAVRAGAAGGLSGCVAESDAVRGQLLAIVTDPQEDGGVRAECLWALEAVLPSLPSAIDALDREMERSADSMLARVAAQILAEHMATERIEWSDARTERIEHVLVATAEPCQHALEALRTTINARELRKRGIPREERIARALSGLRERIHAAFVFGSSAARRQDSESDIDLMVIGDVSLKEMAPALRPGELELGRQINVVIYSQEEWRKRLRERNAFVQNVLREKLIFVIGGHDELAAMAG